MSPQEPEGDAQGSPFPPPFKWGATRPDPKPAQQRSGQPRSAPPVVAAPLPAPPKPTEPVIARPAPPAPTEPVIAPADPEFGAPPVSPPWLAPEPAVAHDRQARGRQSIAPAVLIGVLVLVIVGVVAFVVL
ncbi:hypothetical protein [Rhodococcus maanshanensis]|uniref:Uncharacterized protein n=1 Tax=Rhodococcus maanshanensis TaxID=183556 RepID=A0A1H7V7K8_9NOCA|nr:hypothetical protein [Rhodococcus maanshanensis]SEM05010.1 hypothetical protein SAMN05444583_1213 [Rhodococcus maanshanensis]